MDGVEGFEPPNIGTKNRGLTAWRYPNIFRQRNYIKSIIKNFLNYKALQEELYNCDNFPKRSPIAASIFFILL